MPARKMAAKFAAGMFPAAQRFGRRRNSRGQAKRVQQPVGRQRFNETLIAFQLVEEDSGAQPNLRQWEPFERCVNSFVDWAGSCVPKHSAPKSPSSDGKSAGRAYRCRRSRDPLPAIPTICRAHDRPQRFFL